MEVPVGNQSVGIEETVEEQWKLHCLISGVGVASHGREGESRRQGVLVLTLTSLVWQ